MVESVFSASWYRVADLRPRIRSHAEIHRHHYRGQLWYVLQDHAGGKHHRLTPAAYYVVSLMDGERSVQEIWQHAVNRLGDEAPTQDEVITLLGQLHAADVLRSEVSPDAFELFRRFKRQRKAFFRQRLTSPLAIRIPIWDPERFLRATLPFVRPLFGWLGAILWLAVVGLACILAGAHWDEITGDIVDRVLAPGNLLVLLLSYPLVKALHELGHAYATRIWGGEVHELGLMFLVFVPIPYVDASSASAFREKRKRVIVSAAGILVEAFLGALALLVWLSVESGTVSAIAYSVMLIGGVSTLLFNGNPLLRFDGYHILGDLLEIPNLGHRSSQFLLYLIQRYLLWSPNAESPVTAPGERFWLPVYGLTSLVYRLFVMAAIVLFVASKFFFIGVLIALWSLVAMILVPCAKAIRFLASSPALARNRGRTAVLAALSVAAIGVFVAWFPLPSRTVVEGVVWLPEQAVIRAGTEGSIRTLLAEPDSMVRQGDPLLALEDPFLPVRVRLLQSRLEELELTQAMQLETDLVLAQNTREQINEVNENLEEALGRLDRLVIRAPADGRFVVPLDADLPERFLRQGEIVGYVLNETDLLVRAAVPQEHIGQVRNATRAVELRLVDDVAVVVESSIQRQVPGATDQLPNAALGTMGGGDIAVDPRAGDGLTTLDPVFQMDLALRDERAVDHIGGRAYVRFDHGTEPLGSQVYRAVRRLLLRQFNV